MYQHNGIREVYTSKMEEVKKEIEDRVYLATYLSNICSWSSCKSSSHVWTWMRWNSFVLANSRSPNRGHRELRAA